MVSNDNFCVVKGIANGTSCVFAKVVLNDNAIIKVRRLPNTKIWVPCVLSSQVEAIIMKHTLDKYVNADTDATLPLGHFSIHPMRKPITVKWSKTKIKCQVHGFKVVPNFAFTAHKTQGKTMTEIIVGDYSGHKHNASGWIYVVLSRVLSLQNYFAIKPLTTDLSKYIPRFEIERENIRLDLLSEENKYNLNAAGLC